MLGVTHGQNCFETGVIEVLKKEMLREFGCNYFSTKIS